VWVDIRSDTLTKPTPAMRRAMAEAEVGDDVFGEDPTVNRLEARVAERLGKEFALFVPSGTMANQIAFRLLSTPGDEVLLHEDAHPFHYEAGGAAVISGVTLRLLPGERGRMSVDTVRAAVRAPNVHHAPAACLSVENTANRGGGTVLSASACAELCAVAHEAGLHTHLDGARLWNAHVQSGSALHELAAGFDVVNVCMSKGLGAPVGSLLAGPRSLAERARRVRKMLGGGMRQVGILAAAAEHALDHHVARLADDHARAHRLWEALGRAGYAVEAAPDTNIVYVRVPDAPTFSRQLAARGVGAIALGHDRLRFVTHLDVDDAGITGAIEVLQLLRG
jgi:threonine aldolase